MGLIIQFSYKFVVVIAVVFAVIVVACVITWHCNWDVLRLCIESNIGLKINHRPLKPRSDQQTTGRQ